MSGISIWQLLITILIVGVPIAMYFIIARGPKDDLQRPLRFFHGSFWISVIGTVLLFVMPMPADDRSSLGATPFGLMLALTVAGWTYLIALGVLAHRTGRSWIVWAGLTFITSPIGPIVSYLLMSSRVKQSISDS